MTETETAAAPALATRLFPVCWGHPPDDPTEREAWIRVNITIGEHERALGIPVPWLGSSTMADQLVENDQLVGHLHDALRDGQSGLRYVPKLLRRVLEEGAWRKRYHWATRAEVGFDSFAEFVTAPLTEGLGVDVDFVRRLISDDPVALDLLDQALAVKPGQHRANDNIKSSTGTAKETALRRLRKDRPDLHAKVLEGLLSPHRAMVDAGFRKRTVSVPVDDAEAVAGTLRRQMSPEALARLKELL